MKERRQPAPRKEARTTVLKFSVTEEIPEYRPTADHQSPTGSLTSTYRVVNTTFFRAESETRVSVIIFPMG